MGDACVNILWRSEILDDAETRLNTLGRLRVEMNTRPRDDIIVVRIVDISPSMLSMLDRVKHRDPQWHQDHKGESYRILQQT